MKTIGIYHTKGGVGKSAVTVFLADFLSSLYDKRVLVVDLDPQNNAAGGLVGGEALEKAFAESRSLPLLLKRATQGVPNQQTTEGFVVKRKEPNARGKVKYLAEVSVLAGARADWDSWDDWLADIPRDKQRNYFDLLTDSLSSLRQDYDICLIDFPGSQSRTLAKIGMRASEWWLLPDKPDWFSSGDLDTPVGVVHEAQKNSKHRIRPLGTLLNICPNRGSSSYRKARAALMRMSEEGGIPPLFSKQSEILHRPEALNALDKTSSASKTLVKRYGSTTTPFYTGLRNLTKEVLERLDEKHQAPKLSVLAKFRRQLADYWR
ncbi:MAG: ParA family protein [Verrucomicrobiales bacterium]|nr:ParA family protein [Verrucomicrobiales bacterium]